jgi:hypothetical protein
MLCILLAVVPAHCSGPGDVEDGTAAASVLDMSVANSTLVVDYTNTILFRAQVTCVQSMVQPPDSANSGVFTLIITHVASYLPTRVRVMRVVTLPPAPTSFRHTLAPEPTKKLITPFFKPFVFLIVFLVLFMITAALAHKYDETRQAEQYQVQLLQQELPPATTDRSGTALSVSLTAEPLLARGPGRGAARPHSGRV